MAGSKVTATTSSSGSSSSSKNSPSSMEHRRSSTASRSSIASRRRSSNMSSIDEDLSAEFTKLAASDESGNTILTSTEDLELLEQEFDEHFDGMEDDLDMLGGIRDSLRTDHSKKSHCRKDEDQVSEEFTVSSTVSQEQQEQGEEEEDDNSNNINNKAVAQE